MTLLKKFERTLWILVELALYGILMWIFIIFLSQENPTLKIVTRTLGITVTTFAIVGVLFLSIYGQYDVGRRKSKPIIYSLILAVFFTNIVTYIQLMIMNTVTTIAAFRLRGLELLFLAFIVQIIVIILFTYGGNALFFMWHKPEGCCIITSSQESLDFVVQAIRKYKKQYRIKYIASYRDNEALIKMPKVDTMFVYDIPLERRGELLRYCYDEKINVYFNPEIEDIVGTGARYYFLDDVPMLNRNVKYLTMEQRIAKRIIDIFFAVVLLIATSPIWLVSAIAIKMYDGGSVFFKQKRATINGKIFEVYKFRTMKENVVNKSVVEEDDRITPPGKVLRKIRVDELPQFINVLKGDMSFVGPRPEMIENVEAYEEELPEFQYRLRVKAGLTGYAQIVGKYNTTPKDKLIMDMMYIEEFSIMRDIQLMFQTFIVLLKIDSTEAFSKRKTEIYTFPSVDEKE